MGRVRGRDDENDCPIQELLDHGSDPSRIPQRTPSSVALNPLDRVWMRTQLAYVEIALFGFAFRAKTRALQMERDVCFRPLLGLQATSKRKPARIAPSGSSRNLRFLDFA